MDSSEFLFVATEGRMLIAMLMKAIARATAERLSAANADINGLQLGMLRILRAHPHTSSELAKMFVLDPSTLVPIIDDLEQKGYIERTKDPNDRRRVPLVLTEHGIQLIEKVENEYDHDVLLKAFTALGEDKTLLLVKLLREVISHLPDGEAMICDAHAHIYQRAPASVKQLVSVTASRVLDN